MGDLRRAFQPYLRSVRAREVAFRVDPRQDRRRATGGEPRSSGLPGAHKLWRMSKQRPNPLLGIGGLCLFKAGRIGTLYSQDYPMT